MDKRNPPPEGKIVHFMSVSEDGLVNIWDTRPVDKNHIAHDYIWRPYI